MVNHGFSMVELPYPKNHGYNHGTFLVGKYKHMNLVLFRGHQGVQDEGVGCRSYKSDHNQSAVEIEFSTTWRRWRHRVSITCSVCDVRRCHVNRQVRWTGWTFIGHVSLLLLLYKPINCTRNGRLHVGHSIFKHKVPDPTRWGRIFTNNIDFVDCTSTILKQNL